jgi:chromosome segregation ATPase
VRRLHERREDALARLKAAEAELMRVIDILREIGPRVEMLREQAAKWHEYETVRNELRRRAIRWYRSSFGETARTRADLVMRLANVDAEAARLEDQIGETSTETAASDEELRAAREEEERRRIALSDASANEASVRERIAATSASLEAVSAERGRSRAALAALPAELSDLRARRSSLDQEALAAAKRARESAESARDAEEESSRTRVALAEAQAARVETLLRGQAASLRDAVEKVATEIAAEHPQLPAGVKWIADLGEGIAVASTRAAALSVRGRGLSIVVPEDDEVPTPAGCERVPGLNVFIAPDRRTALNARSGVVVTRDGMIVSGGIVHISASTRTLATLLGKLRDELAVPEGSRDVAAAEAIERRAQAAHADATKIAEEARVEAATSEERRASVVRLRDALDERIADAEHRLAQEEQRARSLEAQERDAQARLSSARAELTGASALAREAERSLELARSRALAAEGSRREQEQKLAKGRERLAELRGEHAKLAVEEERASGALRLLEEQVRAELGLAEDEPLPDPDSLEGDDGPVEGDVMRVLQRLRRKLISLEPVNPLAATELAEVGQRFEMLSTQRADLEKAIADLRTLADELATTIAEQFATTLMAVDREFGLFFQRMFNGGEARLRTSDDADEPGIDIVARPPGKRIGSLTQLSGGERALTAVALLLAILRVRPAPFCVLDEVDAALDERNVGRFTEALRELTDRTQFIVITHNRGTIEAADTMYGVSMDEGGVSKVISMRLSGAERAAGA